MISTVILISAVILTVQAEHLNACPEATLFAIFYQNENCSEENGRPRRVCLKPEAKNTSLGFKPSPDIQFQSFRVLGTWRFTHSTLNSTHYSYHTGFSPDGSDCLKKNEILPFENSAEYKITHMTWFKGTYNPSQIIFTSEPNFQGNYLWISYNRNCIHNFIARSYIHIGNDTWQTYLRNDFRFRETCHCPLNKTMESVVEQGDVQLKIGSVRRDLNETCKEFCSSAQEISFKSKFLMLSALTLLIKKF